jgi:hypothetical protein
VVDCTGFENRRGGNLTGGSTPSLSAITKASLQNKQQIKKTNNNKKIPKGVLEVHEFTIIRNHSILF